MSNDLTTFDFEDYAVRVVILEEQPWFQASDVCRVLDIVNSRDAVSGLDGDEKNTVAINDGNRGNPNKTFISESGLYALIFTSRKAKAKIFRKWVTAEVLPAIRKTGRYEAEAALQSSERGRLAKLRDILLGTAEDVRLKRVTPGQAQAVAITAQRYLESLKLEGDALGYEKVLGLPNGEASDGLLSPRGKAAQLLQDVPQPPLSQPQSDESGLPSSSQGQQEEMGKAPPAEAGGIQPGEQREGEDDLQARIEGPNHPH